MVFDNMVADFRKLGIRKGSSLLVHASLRSLATPTLSPEVVIQSLKEAVGTEGNLLMPALSYKTVTASEPFFDHLTTPSCVGALPEYFRTSAGSKRSAHPTHSVSAFGRDADWFVKDHLKDHTPVGPHSPFARLREADGFLLFLGCGLRPNTSMHGVEEWLVPPYLFGEERTYTLKLSDGTLLSKKYIPHNFSGFEQRYERIEPLLTEASKSLGKVLGATAYLLRAKTVWEKGFEVLEKNPLYFVEKITIH
ncbi:aminoglycoside N3-acetyltransferase [Lunatimonas lonarensis]|uniref:Aminoglycoside N(3)-acetyltransferase n=1 Tax=Lunatimonas lonarensis TaxID=1232681 RepID=R7ZRD3_9BACT|nr:AAC(3) family N-acetyltransferase [Lunatimonas lonarensis]EON76627.1 aminoglycoside N3-acetyltransferase [Lunatimonas lonarensis]